MEKAENLLRTGAAQLGLALSPAVLERLGRYFHELEKWNRKMNLVAAAPAEQLIDRHFLDSLTMLPLLFEQPPADLLDIGSGAGFPGLVLKAALPELPVILVEPRQKRAAFLRHVARTLTLTGVEVVETKLEAGGRTLLPHPAYHLITSRAFSSLAEFLALAAPYCTSGSRVVAMKGSRGQEELAAWQAGKDGNFSLCETIELRLPFSGASRFLFVFRKTGACS